MNEAFVARLINAGCTALGVGAIATLNPYYIAAGAFMICMSFPDCLGYFTEDVEFELIEEDSLEQS